MRLSPRSYPSSDGAAGGVKFVSKFLVTQNAVWANSGEKLGFGPSAEFGEAGITPRFGSGSNSFNFLRRER